MALDYPPQLKAVKKAVVVQPVEMAKKLMDIREQLAVEWKEDLHNVEVCTYAFTCQQSCPCRPRVYRIWHLAGWSCYRAVMF